MRGAKSPTGTAPRLALEVQCGARIAALPVSRIDLRRWVLRARRALRKLPGAADAIEPRAELLGVTLRFVATAEARELNRLYRRRDYATNVLTFGYGHHADIVLCMPVLRREARAQRIALRTHLAHLVIHGVLHAGGLDHRNAREAHLMESVESEIMRGFGLSDPWNAAAANDRLAKRPTLG